MREREKVQEVPRRLAVVHFKPPNLDKRFADEKLRRVLASQVRVPGTEPRLFGTWFICEAPNDRGVAEKACPDRTRPGARHSDMSRGRLCTIAVMADAASLDERLEQIGAQLDWVRDYL